MHWFLWLLFGVLLIRGLFALATADNPKPVKPANLGAQGILNIAMAIGILVYAGII